MATFGKLSQEAKSKTMFNLIYNGTLINKKPFNSYNDAFHQRQLNLINYGYFAEIVEQ